MSIGTNEPDYLSGVQSKRDVPEDLFSAVACTDTINDDSHFAPKLPASSPPMACDLRSSSRMVTASGSKS